MSLLISVDTECWFHANYEGIEPFDRYGFDNRLEHNVQELLDVFDEYDVKATFFVLSDLLGEHKNTLMKIVAKGHDIASHGVSHRLLYTMTLSELEHEIASSKKALEESLGVVVKGFRAASWSINEKIYDDFYKLLAKHGYEYSSSLYPAKKKLFGIENADTAIHTVSTEFGNIVEIPCSVASIFGFKTGFSGGGFFRILPSFVIRLLTKQVFARDGFVNFYVHPRELDVESKKLSLSPLLYFVHYCCIGRTKKKLKNMLSLYEACSLEEFEGID
jgi:polysaccharide deacetylase family protein (PEP-CTERM system associated)